ncbi:hypothetical protein FACS189494_07770 [Spirochaetia bacterium]|nr:hypothetical protein FACS189494_07770 [Spirochaetia bacterium]
MSDRIKRMRIFAGPNGSGKSTLYDYLLRIGAFHSYYFVNADNIARDLPVCADFTNYPIDFSEFEIRQFLDASTFQSLTTHLLSNQIEIKNKAIHLKNKKDDIITYLAAAIADFLRQKMIESNSSFSFESVFSHPSKITELENAKKNEFKTYLYFVAMANPEINCKRVLNRAQSGGHDVPAPKIQERFYKTMKNLYPAFCLCDKVFFFDNSSERTNGIYHLFAEKSNNELSFTDFIPNWFNEYILKRMGA